LSCCTFAHAWRVALELVVVAHIVVVVTVAHIPGPLLECWQNQSDRFAHFMTKQTTINRILLNILF